VFRLERGATGFGGPQRSIDVRPFRTGCYAASRAAGGTLEDIADREYPGTFHSAVVATRAARVRILCHTIHGWIAFVEDGPGHRADPGVFLDPPPWAAVFADLGFTLLGRDLLTTPLAEVDTTALTRDEWRHIRYWRPANVGRTLFNAWD
jgi:hypothetical protein